MSKVIFITWPEGLDEAFRHRYAAITNEEIQQSPLSHNGILMVGSSRCTPEQAETLSYEFHGVGFSFEYPQEFMELENGRA